MLLHRGPSIDAFIETTVTIHCTIVARYNSFLYVLTRMCYKVENSFLRYVGEKNLMIMRERKIYWIMD